MQDDHDWPARVLLFFDWFSMLSYMIVRGRRIEIWGHREILCNSNFFFPFDFETGRWDWPPFFKCCCVFVYILSAITNALLTTYQICDSLPVFAISHLPCFLPLRTVPPFSDNAESIIVDQAFLLISVIVHYPVKEKSLINLPRLLIESPGCFLQIYLPPRPPP